MVKYYQDRLYDYFNWLLKKVNVDEESYMMYNKLYSALFDIQFTPSKMHPMDANRYLDGLDLRKEFDETGELYEYFVDKPCTILEMMVALAYRIEHDIMYDGERNKVFMWFDSMIESLGLKEQIDSEFDNDHVHNVINRFNKMEYNDDGYGGLVYIPNFIGNIKDLDIWQQMNLRVGMYDNNSTT